MSALSPRIGEILSLRGTVRTVEQIAPAGHLRVTLDIAPLKPEEPTGLGAVVEDASGLLWIRNTRDWTVADGGDDGVTYKAFPYDRLDVVRVWSAGVA